MGRVKTTLLKRTALKLNREHGKNFKADFNFNKKRVDELIETQSKKLRNIIAGYLTKLHKQTSKLESYIK